jgi:hypothetical protein
VIIVRAEAPPDHDQFVSSPRALAAGGGLVRYLPDFSKV